MSRSYNTCYDLLTRKKPLFLLHFFPLQGEQLVYLVVNLWTRRRWKCRRFPHCTEVLWTASCPHTDRWALEACIKAPHQPSWPTLQRTPCSSCATAFARRWFVLSPDRAKGLSWGTFSLTHVSICVSIQQINISHLLFDCIVVWLWCFSKRESWIFSVFNSF